MGDSGHGGDRRVVHGELRLSLCCSWPENIAQKNIALRVALNEWVSHTYLKVTGPPIEWGYVTTTGTYKHVHMHASTIVICRSSV